MTATLENWRIAVGALRANWFRAVLTAIGIVIGVASLIAVTAVSAGAKKEVADSIRRLGGNVVKVDGEFISIGTRQSASDRTITPEDVAAIERLPTATAVAPHQAIESLTVSAGRNQTNTWLEGVTATYSSVQNQHAERGRLVSAADESFGRSVVVLGLDADAAQDPHVGRPVGRVAEQRRLADPGLAPQHERDAALVASALEQPIEGALLVLTPYEHRTPILVRAGAGLGKTTRRTPDSTSRPRT